MSKYTRLCVECKYFKPHASLGDAYGRCALNGGYSENERTSWGICSVKGKKWVALTPEIKQEEIEYNKPWWLKLITD